jgi:hypothetical protein
MNHLDRTDLIDEKLTQLEALLVASLGDDWQDNNKKIKNAYLWACTDLVQSIIAAYREEVAA